MKISEIDELAYKLCMGNDRLYNKNNIRTFIIFDYFYKEYYKKAKVLIRKDKIEKLLKNGKTN